MEEHQLTQSPIFTHLTSGTLDLLSEDEDTLSPSMQKQLAYVRMMIRTEYWE